MRRPRQADLKRADSTAYYAMFHTLARDCADRFIGTGQTRSTAAWRQVYRALGHGFAKQSCSQVTKLGFPSNIVHFADTFARLQHDRHRADYNDPDAQLNRADVLLMMREADRAISARNRVSLSHRKTFAALVLLKNRRR
ncbi:hypothetical protein [Thiohalocapsa halophila]|uniref:hypothetical protein n=1 Tax=Thiohalocapsa halophila TaxID=69359 RepID=UPI001908956D|nr:hypothetical protein [Thiohalocapsa halophila]